MGIREKIKRLVRRQPRSEEELAARAEAEALRADQKSFAWRKRP